MTQLDELAEEVGTSGRTLRRAAERGLIRAVRPSPRRIAVPAAERAYVRSHWPLVRELLETLRKQPNVRLAALFGSIARGDDRRESDVDVLVRLRRDDHRARSELREALEDAAGRPVQLVSLEQAESAPLLLADALAEGRVLVDRERDWPRLRRRERQIARRARRQEERLEQLAWAAPDLLEQARSRSGIEAP